MILISKKQLAEFLGLSVSVMHTYISHYTLFKFVKYKKSKAKKRPQAMFVLSEASIYALEEYLKMKMICGKLRNNLKPYGISRLRKYYEENCKKLENVV